MDLRLQLLDSFQATGSDGARYKVCAYDRLARDLSLGNGDEHWASTGQLELRLEDGRLVEVDREGAGHVAGSDVLLTLPKERTARS